MVTKIIACSDIHIPSLKGIDELNLVESEEYTGYKEINMSDEEMSYFYSNIDKNIYNLLIKSKYCLKTLSNPKTFL